MGGGVGDENVKLDIRYASYVFVLSQNVRSACPSPRRTGRPFFEREPARRIALVRSPLPFAADAAYAALI